MSGKIKSEIILVTPQMAKEYLLCNEKNRPVRQGWVNYLAYCIEQNEWKTTHQGVAFADDGRLLDGQHRLMAIAKSGIPVKLMVSYGWDEAIFSAVDNGMRRTDSDRAGVPKKVAECAKFMLIVMGYAGTVNPSALNNAMVASRATPGQIKQYAKVIEDFHAVLMSSTSTTSTIFSSVPSRCAAIAVMMMGHDISYVKTLYRDLVLGKTADLPSIANSAMRQFVTGALNSKGGNDTRLDNFARLILLYKKENKDVQKLILRDRNNRLIEVRNALRPWFAIEKATSGEIAKQAAILSAMHTQAAA